MAAVRDHSGRATGAPRHASQRPKSSVLKSFMHRRNNSDGGTLPSSTLTPIQPSHRAQEYPFPQDESINNAHLLSLGQYGVALGELQQNQQDQSLRLGRKSHEERRKDSDDRGRSPTKSAFATLSLKSKATKGGGKRFGKSRESSPTKPKKTKSATNLTSLLSRPKSSKNLQTLAAEQDARSGKDKENRTPPTSITPGEGSAAQTPIYAQFCVGPRQGESTGTRSSEETSRNVHREGGRPKSFHPHTGTRSGSRPGQDDYARSPKKGSAAARSASKPRPKVFSAISGFGHSRSRSTGASAVEPRIQPEDIDNHLEAMLDRRNIPENQRYKMRNLADTIKMEFIRQDWAEMHASRPRTNDSDSSMEISAVANPVSDQEDEKAKRTRGRAFTLSRGNKDPNTPTKRQKSDSTIGRHFRSKSSDSVVDDRPSTVLSSGSAILSKLKLGQGPNDFVCYLRKVQTPQVVEVGKLHKLRLLLRNETVAWTEDFIRQGGMKEIVELLHRIMEVEWREEHEDALLHETLLCLKALSTTALGLQYLHSIQASLFPKLLHMLFDPEKKGPSEFTTRNIITSIMFTYIESAAPQERVIRAKTILFHLRDPEPKEEDRPIPFVMEMRRQRPYRVWCKEAVSVTKEVFWIFLHNLNVIALPGEKTFPVASAAGTAGTVFDGTGDPSSYMARHFPPERAPVPAAPYVGGVEWDATNYLSSHMDLINAIIACTPTTEQRNAVRSDLRISGWERCLGGSLRLCKEKFYPSVHEGLRTWVAAAADDGWEVKDVRYGPPAEARSPTKKTGAAGAVGGAGHKRKVEEAPKIEMPKLDFGLGNAPKHDGEAGARENNPHGSSWLT